MMFCEIPHFGRCCFCMPLRRGVLVFGYLNVVFSAFMVGIYSYSVHDEMSIALVYHGVVSDIDERVCLSMFCVDLLFNLALVYGAHRKILIYLKVYYAYSIITTVLMIVMEIMSICTSEHLMFIALEISAMFFTGLYCVALSVFTGIHVYLLILTRSLIRKLEISGEHTYENQLNTIVNGHVKTDGNGVYPSTVVPNATGYAETV